MIYNKIFFNKKSIFIRIFNNKIFMMITTNIIEKLLKDIKSIPSFILLTYMFRNFNTKFFPIISAKRFNFLTKIIEEELSRINSLTM
jgi:hypothetical protein